jgi:hypothetical protein
MIHMIHQETEMVDGRIAEHVTGGPTCATVGGLENGNVDMPIGEVVAHSGEVYLLQAKYLLVNGSSLLQVRGAYKRYA